MCLGMGGGKASDPGTYEQWRVKDKTAGGDGSKVQYDQAVSAWQGSDEYKKSVAPVAPVAPVASEETAVEVAEKTEAKKTAEIKEAVMEEKIATVTGPVSTLEKDAPARKRQVELLQEIEAPSSDSTIPVTTPKKPARDYAPNILAETNEEELEKAKAEVELEKAEVELDDTYFPESSLIKKRKQKQRAAFTGLSKKRSKSRGRRSLITGKSGGGIGYYNKYFT